jgi:hypothetical protein
MMDWWDHFVDNWHEPWMVLLAIAVHNWLAQLGLTW